MNRNFNSPSNLTHNFVQIQTPAPFRSVFHRTNTHKTTVNEGELVPIFRDEILPGDVFNLKGSFAARMTTPIFPVLDNMRATVHFFFVPWRLVWENFEKFITGNDGDSTTYIMPSATTDGTTNAVGYQSLFDYLGVPPGIAGLTITSMYARAYELIYQEWYRDQNNIAATPGS